MNNASIQWKFFARLADEFVVAYSKLTGQTPAATVFNIGHAVELYLKATLLKINPSAVVFKYSHDVGKLILDIHTLEPSLLQNYQLKEEIYRKFIYRSIGDEIDFSDEDYPSFIKHQELYWIAKYLKDIKYLGTPYTKTPEAYVFYCQPCSIYWITFLREIRDYLDWPKAGGEFDHITDSAKYNCDQNSKNFLKQLTYSA